MTPQEFCYWLNGYFDLTAEASLSKEQVKSIKSHLALVFKQVADPVWTEWPAIPRDCEPVSPHWDTQIIC